MAQALDSDGTSIQRVAASLGAPLGTPLADSATGAAAALTATLAAAAGERTFITGFAVTGGGATANGLIVVTVTGLATTLNYVVRTPAGAASTSVDLIVNFTHPIEASADNTAIVVNVPSFGAGNLNAAVVATGFRI